MRRGPGDQDSNQDSEFNQVQDEEEDALNAETFDIDVSSIQQQGHFDFGGDQAQILSVDELERRFQQQQQVSGGTWTAEALEAQLMSQTAAPAVVQQPTMPPPPPVMPVMPPMFPGMPPPPPPELALEFQQQFQQAMQHQLRMIQERKEKYDGLMTVDEQVFVASVQLAHLRGDETHKDDFYYRVWSLKQQQSEKEEGKEGEPGTATENAARPPEEWTKNDPEKFQKLLQQVRPRPKATPVAFEGALGSIPAQSLRNPKPLVQIQRKPAPVTTGTTQQSQKQTYRSVLRTIERIYQKLISIDELYRQWQQQQAQGPDPDLSPEEVKEKQSQWNRKYTQIIKDLWMDFHSIVMPTSLDPLALLKQPPSPIDIAYILSYKKGRHLIPRVTRFLPPDQQKLLLASLIRSMASLDVQATEPVDALKELDDYAGCVVYPFVPVVSSIPMQFLNDLFKDLLEAGDVVRLCRVKPGVLFLTLMISRSEIIKQQAQAEDAPEIQRYSSEIYPQLFSTIQSRFAALFPPSHILPSILMSDSSSIMDVARRQPIEVDDQYVWQFLAAVAAGATVDQQRTLVMETRNKIMETVSTQGEKGKTKVNIFLHALGLDASQLQY